MALRNCKECGNEISTKAESCPNCGAVLKKKGGCLSYLGCGVVLFIGMGIMGAMMDEGDGKSSSGSRARADKSSGTSNAKTKAKVEFKEGDYVAPGYTSYKVWKSWWSENLSDNEFLDSRPDATFLFVELTVRNNDTKARSVPPFKLVDENGSEYETTSKGWAIENSIGTFASLNPEVMKQGLIVFDVPKHHTYKLKVSGGFWSRDDEFIQLAPK